METGKEESGIQYKANKYNIISSQDIIFMEIKVALPSGPNSADSCIFVIIIQLVSNAGPSGDDETEVAPRDGENGRGRKASTPRMPPPRRKPNPHHLGAKLSCGGGGRGPQIQSRFSRV